MEREVERGSKRGQTNFALGDMYFFMYVMLCPSPTPPPPPPQPIIYMSPHGVVRYSSTPRGSSEGIVEINFPPPQLTQCRGKNDSCPLDIIFLF